MSDHHFLSYSTVDGYDLALKLADDLAAGPPPFRAWLDKRELQPGLDWDDQIDKELNDIRPVAAVEAS